jgi:hypothetical protein
MIEEAPKGEQTRGIPSPSVQQNFGIMVLSSDSLGEEMEASGHQVPVVDLQSPTGYQ